MRTLILAMLLAPVAAAPFAGETAAPVASKFRAEGTVLVYDTEAAGEKGEIEPDDIEGLRSALRASPGIRAPAIRRTRLRGGTSTTSTSTSSRSASALRMAMCIVAWPPMFSLRNK